MQINYCQRKAKAVTKRRNFRGDFAFRVFSIANQNVIVTITRSNLSVKFFYQNDHSALVAVSKFW